MPAGPRGEVVAQIWSQLADRAKEHVSGERAFVCDRLFVGRRAAGRTAVPWARSIATTGAPTLPVAPVTRIGQDKARHYRTRRYRPYALRDIVRIPTLAPGAGWFCGASAAHIRAGGCPDA